MKTGNAILGSFFLAMGFSYPLVLFYAIKRYNIDIGQLLTQLLPIPLLPSHYFLILLFVIFIALGILCIILGREKRKKDETEEDEIETDEDDVLELFK
ncbi:MAG: hypothetical protein NTW30_05120 [Candidatus Aenigmarchaeota archaeon]|nr:hypothetical protein [Candidatus Aenigmarchaeota archaeon]